MNLFSELYSSYYQTVAHILEKASKAPLTRRQIHQLAAESGPEGALAIVPRLLEGEWKLLEETGDGRYQSVLRHPPHMPFTALQKSWLKALLLDKRISLFFSDEELDLLEELLKDVKPLFHPEDFLYFDRYRDQDPVESVMYRQHFSALLQALRTGARLRISYFSGKNHLICHDYLPGRLEYSPKDGKFRLYAFYRRPNGRWRLDTLNVARILKIEAPVSREPEHVLWDNLPPDIDQWQEAELSEEPVVLEILDERNALERTMLHFASYQKSVERIGQSRRYRCSIYYDKRWETELLIQVLSFGPMAKILGPEHFLAQARERIQKQPSTSAQASSSNSRFRK